MNMKSVLLMALLLAPASALACRTDADCGAGARCVKASPLDISGECVTIAEPIEENVPIPSAPPAERGAPTETDRDQAPDRSD